MKTPSNSMVYETVKQTTNHIATNNTSTCQDEIDAEREPINNHRYFHPPSISSIKFQSRVATITQLKLLIILFIYSYFFEVNKRQK